MSRAQKAQKQCLEKHFTKNKYISHYSSVMKKYIYKKSFI